MTLIRFKQICSDFHPEDVDYFCGDKCHHLRHFIHMFNDKPKRNVFLGEYGAFDEGGIVSKIQ